MKVVLDTNVLLSALLTRGICEAILDACIDSSDITIVVSQHILDEFARHAAGKFGVPPPDVAAALSFLRRNVQVIAPAEVPSGVCKDQDDLPVLGTAVAAAADVLVTGDAELVAIGNIGSTPILTPRAWCEMFL